MDKAITIFLYLNPTILFLALLLSARWISLQNEAGDYDYRPLRLFQRINSRRGVCARAQTLGRASVKGA